jgi:hypothetical protein
LLAVMAHAVGKRGHATGIEIDAALARQSRRDLASLGVGNASVVHGDGAGGHAAQAPFDRVMITAGGHSLPPALFDQVFDGGLVLLPLSNRGGGQETFLLRKTGEHFRSEAAIMAWFVPLTGQTQIADFDGVALDTLPLRRRLPKRPCLTQPMWFGGRGPRDFAMRTHRFRAFLAKWTPGFSVFRDTDKDGKPVFAFGIVDPAQGSLAVCRPDALSGYGSPAAAEAFLAAYRRWTELFMPTGLAFDLAIHRAGSAPADAGGLVERRGGCDLVWSLNAETRGAPTRAPQKKS